MKIDKYDMLDWIASLNQENLLNKEKLRQASSTLAKRFNQVETLSTRQRQQEVMNILVRQRTTLQLTEKSNRIYLEKLKELKSLSQRYWFTADKFFEENKITDKASFVSFVNRSIRAENPAHFKAFDMQRELSKTKPTV